jgi:ubiquinone/menaquinone biosynthesis C-methylase UbiE
MAASQSERAIEVHSRQAAEFDARYERLARNPYESCFAYSRMRLDALLARYIPPRGQGLRVLDVGVGTGHHLAQLRARGYDGAGIDGSLEMLERAEAANPGADLRRAGVSALPFGNRTFDLVLCIEVLRYLDDPRPCVYEMARVLKAGGLCIATATPLFNLNAYTLVNRLAPHVPFVHLTQLKQFFTTSQTLRSHFVAAGFDEVSVHGVYIGPINWVERLLPGALPGLLRRWEHLDARLADLPVLRDLSNMFLVAGVRRT